LEFGEKVKNEYCSKGTLEVQEENVPYKKDYGPSLILETQTNNYIRLQNTSHS
jgi:hypothetical protein